jgi:hypothetical protein
MKSMVDPRPPALPSHADVAAGEETKVPESTRADETGAASFPASDPPAVWTWEVESTPTAPEAP